MAEQARAVRRFVPGTDAPLVCDVCQGDVVGPCFECAHCPGQFTVCSDCEPAATASHAAEHVFLVNFGLDSGYESSAGLEADSSADWVSGPDSDHEQDSDLDLGLDSEADSDAF